MRPRIVIVDDDPAFLATVRVLLEAEGFVVVGEALNGLDGVAVAAELKPDVVLVDVNLPDIDGFEVVERLADGEGAPPVVLTVALVKACANHRTDVPEASTSLRFE